MPSGPAHDEHDDENTKAFKDSETGSRPAENVNGDDVDSKTQYAGVTIDEDHPNDEG